MFETQIADPRGSIGRFLRRERPRLDGASREQRVRKKRELTAAHVLPIRASHVTALAALPMLHKDSFDRILIAQAVAEGLDFVTNDEPISEYSVRTIW